MMTRPSDIETGWWFIFRGDRLLVAVAETAATLPYLAQLAELGLTAVHHYHLGIHDGRPCYATAVSETSQPPSGLSFQALRRLYGLLDDDLFWIAGRASQILNWDQSRRFCGRCGAPTALKPDELAKTCPQCGHIDYPNPAPAIIVLVEKDNQLLLARSHRHPSGMFSILAGFVEPGENLEAAVVREIREEVGIEVKEIRYFGSQPWPFPNSLMIAFTCLYAGGELRLEDAEITEAGWYTAGNLPTIPPPISIARQLIDWFVTRHDDGSQQ